MTIPRKFTIKINREKVKKWMTSSIIIIYFPSGLVQFLVIFDTLTKTFGKSALTTLIPSLILAYTPILGTILATYGLIETWNLNITKTAIYLLPIFTMSITVLVVLMVGGKSLEKNKDKKE